jgi:hypothetical protein
MRISVLTSVVVLSLITDFTSPFSTATDRRIDGARPSVKSADARVAGAANREAAPPLAPQAEPSGLTRRPIHLSGKIKYKLLTKAAKSDTWSFDATSVYSCPDKHTLVDPTPGLTGLTVGEIEHEGNKASFTIEAKISNLSHHVPCDSKKDTAGNSKGGQPRYQYQVEHLVSILMTIKGTKTVLGIPVLEYTYIDVLAQTKIKSRCPCDESQ